MCFSRVSAVHDQWSGCHGRLLLFPGRKFTQREFVMGLIGQALAEAEADTESSPDTAPVSPSEAPEKPGDEPQSEDKGQR